LVVLLGMLRTAWLPSLEVFFMLYPAPVFIPSSLFLLLTWDEEEAVFCPPAVIGLAEEADFCSLLSYPFWLV
jgi:hypothetical protein